MFAMKSVNDLWDHIAYVMAYAPDQFPYREFIPDDQQMNLDRAFDQLREGVEVAYPEPSYVSKRDLLNDILNRSYAAYRANDDIAAGHLLNEFQDNIFKTDK